MSTSEPIEMEPPVAPAQATRLLWCAVIGLLLAGPVAAGFVGRRDRPTSAVALSTLRASADSVAEAQTITITSTSTTDLGDGEPMVMRTTLAFDNEARAGRYELRSDRAPELELEGVLTADTHFLRLPPEARPRAEGKLWVATSTLEDASTKASNPANVGVQLLENLAGAKGRIEVRGTEEVGGVNTTRYRVDIDVNKRREPTGQTGRGFGPGGAAPDVKTTSSTADVWLDDDGRPRRLRLHTTMEVGDKKVVSVHEGDYDYDKPVLVWVPPSDQVHHVDTLADAYALLYESSGRGF